MPEWQKVIFNYKQMKTLNWKTLQDDVSRI